MVSLLIMVALLALQLLLTAVAIRLTTRWARIESRGWRRIAMAAVAILVANAILALVGAWMAARQGEEHGVVRVMSFSLLAQLAATFLVINIAFRSTFLQTLKIWTGPMAASLATVAVVFGLLNPFVMETYASPTNSMSPALRGTHAETRCDTCGGKALVSLVDNGWNGREYSTGLCADCYAPIPMAARFNSSSLAFAPKPRDRFSANKLRTPSRWDITVYLTPDRKLNYVHRVVGLPGETVQMTNNQLLINGQPVTPPAQCAKIHFGEILGGRSSTKGLDTPVQLADNEYFVIGDNQSYALDSRFTGPVPRDRIVGVVDLIYWPPSRMQILP